MSNLYLYGYGTGPWGASTTKRTKEYILSRSEWAIVHPELMRRLFALADFVIAQGRQYGFGGGGRTTQAQYNLFKSRYTKVPAGTSYDVFWDGTPFWLNERGYYRHTSGATAAPPGRSYHEQTTNGGAGMALAVDMVGDHGFANPYSAEFGLVNFSRVNAEPWHYQGVEYPKARVSYDGEFESPTPWPLPGDEEEDMTPIKPSRVYDSRNVGPFGPGEVRRIPVAMGVQAEIAGGCQGNEGWWAYSPDGDFSAPTSFVNVVQDGRWHNWGGIPVLCPGGHVYVKSLSGGHIYIDTYATKT